MPTNCGGWQPTFFCINPDINTPIGFLIEYKIMKIRILLMISVICSIYLLSHINAKNVTAEFDIGEITYDENGQGWVEFEMDPFTEAMSGTIIDLESGTIEDCISQMYDIPIKKFIMILEENVFDYNDLSYTYKTPLQIEAFKNSQDYLDMINELKWEKECIDSSVFNILVSLKNIKPFDLERLVFDLPIHLEYTNVPSNKDYVGLGKNICIKFPKRFISNKATFNQGLSVLQKLILPCPDKEIALQIENDIFNNEISISEDSGISTYLLIKAKFKGLEKEKKYIQPNFNNKKIECKNLLFDVDALYFVNMDKQEIIYDLTKILE